MARSAPTAATRVSLACGVRDRGGRTPHLSVCATCTPRRAAALTSAPRPIHSARAAVDTSGHFYAAVSCTIDEDDVLLALNTTNANYLAWPMAGLLHGYIFGSAPEAGAGDADEPCQSSTATGAVAELVAMGFEEAAVRAALAQVGGSVSGAVEVLVGSS